MFTPRVLFAMAMSLGSVVTSSSAVEPEPPSTGPVFPLMAWNSVPSDAATFQRMRECGLTVAGFVAPKDLDLCHSAGLMAIVRDPRASGYDWNNVDESMARKNLGSLIAEVGNHPAVYGYYLIDEPHASLFPGLAKVSSLVHELAPGKWPYINLFPNYASRAQLGNSNYLEHLEQFVRVCRPRELSYDHYALMDDGSLRHGYWQNLEQMRDTARRHRLPFWNIVLTVAHFNYREPNAADLRFQVYSTLAYGGRGIAYFTYFAPAVGNYRMAPIDQYGHLTPTWHALQNVNLQVGKLAPTLLQLSCEEVYHFGSVPADCHAPSQGAAVRSVGGAEAVVGDFLHRDGSRYIMIVNKDLAKSRHCQPKFATEPKRLQMVSPYSGQLEAFTGEHCWLAPGQGVLLRLE